MDRSVALSLAIGSPPRRFAGQFAVAMVVDHFGRLVRGARPITAAKPAGLALRALGTRLNVRD